MSYPISLLLARDGLHSHALAVADAPRRKPVRAGAFIGWHGEITRPPRTGFNTQRDDDENDHQSTRVKHPSITFETLVMKDHKPKPSHHASSICEISSGQFLVSWFAGQFES